MTIKEQLITITNENGQSIQISNHTICNMIVKQIKGYNRMIERAQNNPHLTKEELNESVKFDLSNIELMNELNKLCQS